MGEGLRERSLTENGELPDGPSLKKTWDLELKITKKRIFFKKGVFCSGPGQKRGVFRSGTDRKIGGFRAALP